ncbi:probable carboxylesterase 2 [Salvia hispanica]|uniref:probable carboxylesterase 2 n=1 Tax=Salvia hispanica TaxID=49212 RepID=UPI0020094971|nr:probable carboxylesterase 2 [Salvia hispanica]
MSINKSYPLFLFFFFIFYTLAANSTDISYEIIPFIRVYKNGSVERLIGTDTVPPSLNPKSKVLSKDIIIEPSLNISARLFLPRSASTTRKLPLLVYIHGGAFFTGSSFTSGYHGYLNSIVAEANAVAVSINYRLAPEHPLPAAYQDSWLVLKWIFSHSKQGGGGTEAWLRNNVDFDRVYVSGDSAGGNIAHNLVARAGLESGVKIRGLFLNCPHFWGKERIGNEASDPKMVVVEDNIWIYAYPNSTGLDDPQLNPDYDPNLSKLGCKKVVVYVAENDILRDRGLQYKKALEKIKWKGEVKAVDVKGAVHVFNLIFPKSKDSIEMLKHFALFLNDKEKLN